MKYILIILLIFFFVSSDAQQNKKDELIQKSVITIGASSSLVSRLALSNLKDSYNSQKLPPLNLMLDLKSKSSITLGFAVLYEKFTFYKQDTTGIIGLSSKKQLYTSGNFSKLTLSSHHLNVGIRLLAHSKNPNNDFYGGFRLGYDYYTKTIIPTLISSSKFKIQVILGLRKYIGDFGLNTEIAIGQPYWFMGGVNFKLD